jgi:autotransporter passenger strand-loop-strand repeat protein
MDIVSGGSVFDATVDAGGFQVVSGGEASGTVLGGSQIVTSFGETNDTIVLSGGAETVSDNAQAVRTLAVSHGVLFVESGGVADDATAAGGGVVVESGGLARHATAIGPGGVLVVRPGGVAADSFVLGGIEIVESGGAASGVTISGGILEVRSGGSTGSAPVTFTGPGELTLSASMSFGGLVAGFQAGDLLDLRDIAFGAGAHVSFTEAGSNLSGTLTVADGVHTANIALLGQYAANQFTAASDGNGGTLIGDPPAGAAAHPAALAAHHA